MCARLRNLAILASFIAATAAPAHADLNVARAFAALSSGGSLAFGRYDLVIPAINPDSATCPSGLGCTIYVGAQKIGTSSGDRLYARATTAVANPGAAVKLYAQYLGGLPVTSAPPAIMLKPGSGTLIATKPGLTVIATPA